MRAAAAPLVALMTLAAPAMAQDARPYGPLLSLSAQAEAQGVPDVAEISIRVETQAPQSGLAMTETGRRMTAVLAAVRATGIAAQDIATTDVALYPRRERLKDDEERLSYVASTAVRVRVRALERLGDVIDAATRAGADQIDAPSFMISDMAGIEDEARALAVARLFDKARNMACAAGMYLGRLVALGESGADAPGPMPRMAMMMRAEADAMAPPIEPGLRSAGASVTGTWEMTPDEAGRCQAPR
jgi:hypothetical protein